ncbi:O-antigen polymerase [Pseudoalteromonas lipolytica]|uniref:O-antigen ligase n=1 Tax=Pseudoalteromonas lipolytica TaxID=570156 RepID=A0ABU8SVT1_9GAMM
MREKYMKIRERFSLLILMGYIFFSITLLFIPLGVEDLFLILSYFTLFFFVFFFLNYLFPFFNLRLSGKIILGYLFFAYVVKLLYVLAFTERVKAFNQLSVDIVLDNLTVLLPEILLPTLGLVVVIWVFSSVSDKKSYSSCNFDIKMNKLFVFIFIVILAKFFIHNYLSWGVPGVEPKNVIPGITGLLTFFVRFPLFCIVNVYFIISIYKKSRCYSFLSIMLILFYVLIDLLNGSKYSLIYEVFFLMFALYFAYKNSLIRLKSVCLFIIVASFVLPIYKYINYIRFATMDGAGIYQAIEVASINVNEKKVTFLDEFINRINGIEHSLYALNSNLSSSKFDLMSLLTDQMAVAYTESVTGVGGIVNSVGSSQVAVIILNSNFYLDSLLLSICYFSLSFIVLRWMFFCFSKKITSNKIQALSLEVIFSLFYIYFLFGTGNFIFFLKEMLVISASFLLLKLFVINDAK